MTLRVRLAVVVAGAVAAAVLVALGVAFLFTHHRLRAEVDDALEDRAASLAELPTVAEFVHRPSPVVGSARGRSVRDVQGVRLALIQDLSIQLIGENGRMTSLAGTEVDVRARDLDAAAAGEGAFVRNARVDGVHYRVATQAVPGGGAVQVARSVTETDRTLRALAVVLATTAAVGVLGAALLGLLVSKRALRPIDRLSEAAERVARDQDLTAPVPVPPTHDEVGRLAQSLNTMLAALATSRAQQQRLVTDASHELRTPLTSLRTNLDLLTQAGDEGLPRDAHEELLTDVRAQIEELTTLIGDLMELARDEQLTLVVETTDLEEILDRALARVRRRAPGITFDVDTHAWWVDGDPAALERAVTNLLDNAAKWSPPGGIVTVRLVDGTLTVDDEGPGISPEDLPHVFERFYRAEESRSMPGSGLGLAIVRQVAERHGGSAEAGAAPGGGARLTMTIPGRRVESAPALPEEAATDQTLVATGRPSIVTRRTPRQGPTGP